MAILMKRRRPVRRPRRRMMRRRRGPLSSFMPQPKVYNFKRRYSEVVALNTQAPPSGWSVNQNSLTRNLTYKLSDLVNYQEFTSLFRQYKINAVKLEFFFSNTQSGATANPDLTSGTQIQNANNQVLMWVAPNVVGANANLGPNEMLEIQSAKKRVCINGGKPIVVFHRTKQLSNTYGGVVNNDYATMRPRYISTSEPSCIHYGQSICLERADQTVFASNSEDYQNVRIIYTYYITCKQVI